VKLPKNGDLWNSETCLKRSIMIEAETNNPDTEWSAKNVEWKREIAGIGTVTSEKRTRPEGSQITFTTIHADDRSPYYYDLLLDNRFVELGIETESNGLLINQNETREKWKSPAGIKPEQWMAQNDSSLTPSIAMLGFPATNAFWQKGEFFIKHGKVLRLPEDETLTRTFEMLTLTDDGWSAQDISLVNGEAQNSTDTINIGMSMPLVVKNASVIPQSQLVAQGRFRALADLRNFVDFSVGAAEDPEFNFRFFDLVRRFQPSTLSGARRIAYEGGIAVVRANVSRVEAEEFKAIIEDKRWGLENFFRVAEIGDKEKPTKVVIQGPFPPNRTPVTIIGHDYEGKLIAGFFNGRQKDSSGVTFDEAATIMKEKGAVNAGIGAAGGDVAVILKTTDDTNPLFVPSNRFEILNSPSNKDHQTRPAPNMLTLKLPDPMAGFLY